MRRSKPSARTSVVAALALAAMLAAPSQSGATFPGSNGKIVFSVNSAAHGQNGFYTMDPDGQNLAQISSEPGGDFNPGPEYSSDGEQIVFARSVPPDVELGLMDSFGQNQALLTDNASGDVSPSFFPGGGRIAFVRVIGMGDPEIFAMDLSDRSEVPLTDNGDSDTEPSVSPDGTRIAFVRDVGGDGDVFVMNADGTNQTPMTDNAADEEAPSFSPTGEQILFARNEGMSDREIVVMPAGGGSPTPLTDTTAINSNPVFSPDGRRIAFTRFAGDTEVFVMDADGQHQVPLTDNAVTDFAPSWQPINPPALDLTAAEKQKSTKFVAVTASSNEDAAATISGTLTAPKAKPKASASKKKTFELPPVTVDLQPGQPVTLTLEVPKKGRKLLKRALKAGKKGSASITATATDDLGSTAQDSQGITIKKKKPK
jgi:Tol biopolymer transport system component